MINEEEKAWIKKYFKADSDEYLFFLFIINGIIDNRFNSNPTQEENHEKEEIAKIDPRIRVDKKIMLKLDK